MIQHYTIHGATPMGAPRQTRADKWLLRPCVLRYREFRDAIKAGTKGIMTEPLSMVVIAYLPIPKSIKGKKREDLLGQPHRVKPDADNIYKAVSDAIIPDDQRIASETCFKYWAEEPRIEVFVSDGHLVGHPKAGGGGGAAPGVRDSEGIEDGSVGAEQADSRA